MKYIDMHCDTLMEAFFAGKEDIYEFPNAMVDLRRMAQGMCMAQFFAVFLPCNDIWEWYQKEPVSDDEYIEACENIFYASIKQYPAILAYAGNGRDIEDNHKKGLMSALLTMEDGRAVQGKISRLEEFYKHGFRLISLTWNDKNCFGSPNSRKAEIMKEGLTPFGKEAVVRMNELGMLVDVSHLSDGGFYDVSRVSKKPFVASHSNCREICNHPRNLTNDMLRILGERGGVAGVNFGPEFLDDTPGNEDSRIEQMACHLKHMIRYGGIECAAIGTDFDGIEGNLEISSPAFMDRLFEHLKKDGLSSEEIEKIAYKNVMRVLHEVL